MMYLMTHLDMQPRVAMFMCVELLRAWVSLPASCADANDWEDVKVTAAHPEVKSEHQSDQQATLADEDDWEDV